MVPPMRAFILQNTRLQRPSRVPELELYLAGEIMPIWQASQERLDEGDAAPPYWAFAWAGGQAIARYLLDHPQEVAGKSVMDAATGSGLCAIAAMRAGASRVLAVDIDACSEQAVALNAQANGVEVAFTRRDMLDSDPPEIDLILAGDICYEKSMAARMLPWLRVAAARGTCVLIGDPGRRYFPPDGLMRLAHYQVPTTRELEGVEVKETGVFTFPS